MSIAARLSLRSTWTHTIQLLANLKVCRQRDTRTKQQPCLLSAKHGIGVRYPFILGAPRWHLTVEKNIRRSTSQDTSWSVNHARSQTIQSFGVCDHHELLWFALTSAEGMPDDIHHTGWNRHLLLLEETRCNDG